MTTILPLLKHQGILNSSQRTKEVFVRLNPVIKFGTTSFKRIFGMLNSCYLFSFGKDQLSVSHVTLFGFHLYTYIYTCNI